MSYRLHIPTTLEQALEIRRRTDGTYLAAGTVILVNHRHSGDLISLEKIKGLSSIEDDSEAIRIGALTTFADIENSDLIKENLPALWQAAFSTAGPQIRNRATIGGNIGCFSPASDAVTALVALDAEVQVFDGSYHNLKLENLRSLEKEAIITSVVVPKRFGFSAFGKVGKRNAMSVSVINMAIAKTNDEVRLAVGCASPYVLYCKATSESLCTRLSDLGMANEILLSEIHPINDRWGTVEYRRAVAVNLLEKLVKEAGL